MAQSDQLTIVIADDHQSLRNNIRTMIERKTDFLVVGEAVNGLDAVLKVRELCPDVLLLDIHMPIMDGMETLEVLRKTDDRICIIILSAFDNKFFVNETIAKGANGYVLKEDAPIILAETIINCARHKKVCISPKLTMGKGAMHFPVLPEPA